MRLSPHRLQYFLRSAVSGMRANPVTTLVATVTIGMTLLLIGVFLLLLQNMESVMGRFGDSLHVSVYFEDGLPQGEIETLVDRFTAIEGVSSLTFISKEEALNRFRERVAGQAGLLEGLEENPLPASVELALDPERRSLADLKQVAASIEGIPGIDEVISGGDWVDGYASFINLARVVSVALGGVLAFAALLIVANTIQLAIYARRDELEILQLVGASRTFAGTPFLLEGFMQGLLGGCCALFLLYSLFELLLPFMASGWTFLLGNVPPHFLSTSGMLALVLSGAGLGLLGSGVALMTARRV